MCITGLLHGMVSLAFRYCSYIIKAHPADNTLVASQNEWTVDFVLIPVAPPYWRQVELLRGYRSIRNEVRGSSLFLTDISWKLQIGLCMK